ncbi:MAG TPA: cyclic pyranopterin monophosphate synthase MoaC [Bacteroidales bacterium]|nr:cyclic pyranopterin monophosphate synthase MoaC [Bacteroidales bacterium]
MKELTHTDKEGKARMVDVGGKDDQKRIARAKGHITLNSATIALIVGNELKKGDVLTVAQLAGIQAAKNTSDLIPLCHNIVLDRVEVKVKPDKSGVYVESLVSSTGKTGVEMEALTAVSVALLTVYDMCKAVDKEMIIDNIELTEKTRHDIT